MSIILVLDDERARYWVCMNNGKPVISPSKKKAAEFYGEVVDSAVRQIKTIYGEPDYKVIPWSRAERFSRKKLEATASATK